MTTIKATCPECGDVDLTPAEVRLEVRETLAGPLSDFAFDCRTCEAHVRGEATDDIVRSLERAGVLVRLTRLPAEVREEHQGAPISEDEVIAFGQWLESAIEPIRALQPA